MKKAVILVSGGLDSCVAAAYAINMGYEPAFIHFNYFQRTQERELKSFLKIADHYNVRERLSVDLDYFKLIGGSSLVDEKMQMEQGEPKKDKMPSTYVPFRNANMLSIAVSWAEVIGAERIFIGVVDEDSSGYPDCTKVFYEKFNALLEVGLSKKGILIETPLISLSKSEIVKLGLKLGAPLEYTWSCYQNNEKACGVCESCFLRLRGFSEAGEKDKIEYE